MDRKNLIAELAAVVGDDGTGDLGVIVDTALADDPSVSVAELVDIVREARSDASLERALA